MGQNCILDYRTKTPLLKTEFFPISVLLTGL